MMKYFYRASQNIFVDPSAESKHGMLQQNIFCPLCQQRGDDCTRCCGVDTWVGSHCQAALLPSFPLVTMAMLALPPATLASPRATAIIILLKQEQISTETNIFAMAVAVPFQNLDFLNYDAMKTNRLWLSYSLDCLGKTLKLFVELKE